MSNISSNTLFHFTPKAEYLISILKNNYMPRYCLEKMKISKMEAEIAIPMVCFCDIPLSQIKNHIETYGVYGIGMTKEWAEKNGLNPVLYLKQNSKISVSIQGLIEHFTSVKDEKNANGVNNLAEIVKFIKPYEGDFLKDAVHKDNIRFYNEREWRYVPSKTKEIKNWIDKDEYNNEITRSLYNEKLKDQTLKFEPDDIKYIIVKEEKEITATINALKDLKEKYNPKTINLLTSRIITVEQILNDL